MFAKPQEEHRWLDQFIGAWTFESECDMGPDKPSMKGSGTVTCRSLEGLWILMDLHGSMDGEDEWKALLSLGFDPQQGRFVGTFIGSMGANLWVYSGTLDDAKRKLTLDTTGPKFDQSGMTQYQDIVELLDDDRWGLSSQIRGDDGNWRPFMRQVHRRLAS